MGKRTTIVTGRDMPGVWHAATHSTPRTWSPEEITHCRQVLLGWGIEDELIAMLGVDATPSGPVHLDWMIVETDSAMRRDRARAEERATG